MKIIKYISVSLIFINMSVFAIDPVSIATMLCSAVSLLSSSKKDNSSLLGNLLASKEQISLKNVNFNIDANVNNNAAIEIHVVILYDEILFKAIKELNSNRYFQDMENLKKLNPNKIVILKFEFVAKAIITTADISKKYPKDGLEPIGALVFARYSNRQSSADKHVAVIPIEAETIILKCKRDNFDLEVS